jgi:hypothetical protein
MDPRISKAIEGKSASQGGLNLPEIKAILSRAGVDTSGSGTDLRRRLATVTSRIQKRQGGQRGQGVQRVQKAQAEQRMQVGDILGAPRPKYVPKPGLLKQEGDLKSMLKVGRISGRAYLDKYGPESVGDKCDIRGDGELKCLLASSRWVAPSANKTTDTYRTCGPAPWEKKCKL